MIVRPEANVHRADRADIADRWLQATAGQPAATLAHAPEWLDVISEAYGHEALYLAGEDTTGHAGVLPAFIIRRPLAGPVVTSMPFLDSGGPVAASPVVAHALVDALLSQAHAAGARLVELRAAERLDLPSRPREDKVNMALRLPRDAGVLWRALDKSVRNQVRKAEKAGLEVQAGGRELLGDFYTTFAARMHELGSPVHARSFFDAVVRAFGDRARVVVIRKGRLPVGGLIALATGRTLAVPWAGSEQAYLRLCPNMLLYWETLRQASADGIERFEFGRSTRGSGTWQFKRQWGAEEQPLFWYTLPLRGASHAIGTPGHGRGRAFLAGSWRRLPRMVTRQLGPVIRRYLTQ